MRVHHTHDAEAVAAAKAPRAAAKEAPKTSFAAALAKSSAATTTTGTTGANTTPTSTTETTRSEALPKGPKGETTREVKDHPYLEIMSGPRNGMFINTTHNVRRGQAFALVHKADHDLHVYGTGKNRRVIISWHKDQPAHRNDAPPAAGQTGGTTATTS